MLRCDASKVRNSPQRRSGGVRWILGQLPGRVRRALPPHFFYSLQAQILPVSRAYSVSLSHRYSPYSRPRSPSSSDKGRQVLLRDFNIHPGKFIPPISVGDHLTNLHPTHHTHSLATVQPTPFILTEPPATSPEGPHPQMERAAMTPIIPPNHQPHLRRSFVHQGMTSGLIWECANGQRSWVSPLPKNPAPPPPIPSLVSIMIHTSNSSIKPISSSLPRPLLHLLSCTRLRAPRKCDLVTSARPVSRRQDLSRVTRSDTVCQRHVLVSHHFMVIRSFSVGIVTNTAGRQTEVGQTVFKSTHSQIFITCNNTRGQVKMAHRHVLITTEKAKIFTNRPTSLERLISGAY